MQDLNTAELTNVVGGASKNDQIMQQITALQTSLKDAVSGNKNNGGNDTFMLLAMMMAMRPQSATVVAAGGPAPVAAGPSSIISISNRIRR